MHRVSLISLLFCSMFIAAQTAPAKPAAKKPAAAATSQTQSAAKPTATIETTAGALTCELFQDKAPNAVANFAGLATGTKDWTEPRTGQTRHGVPLYDGTIFHRVIPEFMIQGGDPLGSGTGDPGYKIPDELSPDLKFDQPGRLAYANSGPNTNGSQFFITEIETPFLNPCFDPGGCPRGGRVMPPNTGYVIFGQCTPESVELVKKIARLSQCVEQGPLHTQPPGPCDPVRSHPTEPVKIVRVKISGIPGLKPAAHAPAKGAAAKKAPAKKSAKP